MNVEAPSRPASSGAASQGRPGDGRDTIVVALDIGVALTGCGTEAFSKNFRQKASRSDSAAPGGDTCREESSRSSLTGPGSESLPQWKTSVYRALCLGHVPVNIYVDDLPSSCQQYRATLMMTVLSPAPTRTEQWVRAAERSISS
ncbi:hypothetical protein GWK47_031615 [Chionoecetes opilio]|uniref:Uncharacterized protein n=1 Tax=Chionoecetes opilio TaxID=41210 RepID=A0A8J5D4S2_CHIOP|nr:hypothetical protein GWK47_031615 [Chionoecetes opilio]